MDRLAIAGLPQISFEVAASECVAIEGPSGSGKTRILRAISDLDPAGGYVFLEGAERSEIPAHTWRKRVRYVSAEPAWWAETARAHIGRQPDLQRFERFAASLGIDRAALDRPIAQLSTGERLRLGLARACCDEPSVLLLDEPTGALDATASALTEELIRFLLLARRSIILVSHDAAQIARVAHKRLQLAAPRHAAPAKAAETTPPVDDRIARLAQHWDQPAMTYHALGYLDIGLAGLLLGINAILSWGFKLGLERQLLIAGVRMVAQLGAIGFVLKFIFETGSLPLTLVFAATMIVIASWEAIARARYRIGSGWQHWGLGAAALMFSGFVGTLYAVGLIIATDPWWAPRTLLPVLGMVLGNALTGVSLILDTITTTVKRERSAIEARLALGQPRFEAMRDVLGGALKTAMMPIVNAMAAAGVVSLPGMMTGQILAGAEPVEAAKYQIMILCVIAGTTALGTLLAGFGAVLLLTDRRHRLRTERLVAAKTT